MAIIKKSVNSKCWREFPHGPAVRTLTFTAFNAKAWVPSLVGELRSHKPSGMTTTTNNKNGEKITLDRVWRKGNRPTQSVVI